MRTARTTDLALDLSRDSEEPLPLQLASELRRLVSDGVLLPGEPVPATRALAERLDVARGTVVAAYDQLLAEGYLVAERGAGTRVNPNLLARHHATFTPGPVAGPAGRVDADAGAIDLRPGRPSVERIPGPAWRTAWKRAAARPFDIPHDELGAFRLRAELAEHLRLMRSVLRGPEEIVVTSGTREGLSLLLVALESEGRPRDASLRIGVEDPGYPSLRRVPARLGLEVRPLPADTHGLVVEALPAGPDAPDVVIVTPSHQYPLGGSLPVDRRLGLLDWARTNGVWVVEDDYDSELRYTSSPLPALAALDEPSDARVATLGTFAKTIGPGLGAGYLVPPVGLLAAIRGVRSDLGQPVSLVVQQALANYLEGGELRRHTQRMRHLYKRRRDEVVRAFAGIRGARVYPMDGGLHAVVETGIDESALLASAQARGVLVAGLSRYWSAGAGLGPEGGAAARRGLVFGFGGVSDEELRLGLAALREVCADDPVAPGA